ncbi:hypothetical protein [Streptomyces sp. CA-132043]|uniref:hypothetical protein n=1 Tax=Streptomyces sp. CA-132043 TaxID=3240048 RepID=UPI003D9324BE
MEPGERWAYRAAPYAGPVSEVEVLRLGSQRPLRVKVRFCEEAAEGRQEWVPPARLRVRWEDKEPWLARQERWAQLTLDGPDQEDPEFYAASMVFEECPLEGVVSMGWNYRERGVLYVHDSPALAALLKVPEASFCTDPRTFTDEEGTLTAPWPTTLATARLIAQVHADALAATLAREEEQAQRDAAYGKYYRGRGGNPGTYIHPEICAEVHRERQPGRDLVREWCGAQAIDQVAELAALRTEVLRIGKLMEHAIQTLRLNGHTKAADQLERQLGIPVEVLRHATLSDPG